jgi:Predicted membrane protein (DUF2232)
MVQMVLIGLGAGAAAALLFASVASGSLLSVFLFYLSALPILIAALGWSHWAALIAAAFAAAGLASVFGGFFLFAFLIGVGVPAWWLGYLALLARPAGNGAADLEWYPVGHLVAWAAVVGSVCVIAAIPHFGTDAQSFNAALAAAFERVIRLQTGTPAEGPLELPGVSEPKRLIDFLVMAMPPAAAVLATVTHVFNLWLAARIVNLSGRLRRPWPDIPSMTFPVWAPLVLAAATAASFAPDLTGIAAGIVSASLLMAYAILGFAVVHSISRRLASRPLVIAGTYVIVFAFGWPIIAMTVLGLIDTMFNIRGRVGLKHGPPAAPLS